MKELPIPPAAAADTTARELARVWAASGAQHVSLEIGLWPDPAAWGLLLVDLARHVAKAYGTVPGHQPADALARIREAFDAEWTTPTGSPNDDV